MQMQKPTDKKVSKKRKKPDCYTREHSEFLDELRASGETNMWGAGPYLSAEFPELGRSDIRDVMLYWMQEFKPT